MSDRINRLLFFSVIITFLVKMLLSARLPVTSDEAYFALWGRFVALGYYDHPPMIGWLLHLVTVFGSNQLAIRLPAVISPILVGLGIYLLLKEYDRRKAALAAMLFMVSPLNLLNFLITTDTPLLLFTFASVFFLFRALTTEKRYHYLLSGSFLGLAFLSKYFAVLLVPAYLLYYVLSAKDRRRNTGFLLLFAAALPFLLLNLYWNYTHCWANIMFNLFNRNRDESISVVKVGAFFLVQLYLLTPPVIYFLLRRGKEVRSLFKTASFAIFAFVFILPLGFFALLSPKKIVGLHWVISFYPFLYVLLFALLSEDELKKSIRFMAVFSLAHVVLVGGLLAVPLKYSLDWKLVRSNKNYPMIVLGTRPGQMLAALRQFGKHFVIMTPSYADSALLSFHSGRYYPVFGGGSHHARQDDILTDFRQLDGRNILILRTSPARADEYRPFFQQVEISTLSVEGAAFYAVKGYGFDAQRYRDIVLAGVRDKYYRIPSCLPLARSSGYFFAKYFPGDKVRRR